MSKRKIVLGLCIALFTTFSIASTQKIETFAQMNKSIITDSVSKGVVNTGKTLTSSLGTTYALKSQNCIKYDNDNDGTPDVVFDAKDFETLFEICK